MTSYSSHHRTVETGQNAWLSINSFPYKSRFLDKNINCDWLILGGGFAGLSAAYRLQQLRPKDKVVLIDALKIGEGSACQNSGFMIDLPHNISASGNYTDSLEKDKKTIEHHRHAMQFAKAIAEECGVSKEDFLHIGKINGAATPSSVSWNDQYQKQLQDLSEDHQVFDRKEMKELTGSEFYESGLYTPGTVLFHPSNYVRTIATKLRESCEIFDDTPATSISSQNNSWLVQTPKASISSANIIFAINGHIQNFGFYKNRLIHLFTFAAVTKKFSKEELSGKDQWGITPANPVGTTVRKIKDGDGFRLLVRNQWQCHQSMQINQSILEAKEQQLRQSFEIRFPILTQLPFEFTWGGKVCLSMNNVPAFGELDHGLYSACCSNGLGSINGTLAGKFIIDKLCQSNDQTYLSFENADKPTLLPPNFLIQIGANLNIKTKEWRAGKEL